MPKRSIWMILPLGLVLTSVLLPTLGAQTVSPRSVDEIEVDPWNSLPLRGRDYAGVESAPAPRRDLSGIWTPQGIAPIVRHQESNTTVRMNTGLCCLETPRPPGGQADERNIANPLPYTPLGEATLKTHRPTGQGVRSVPAALGNDPVNICDPPGFPRMAFSEFRNLQIVQMPDHMLILNQKFSHLAHRVDRWARTPDGSRTKVVRLLSGRVGGRLHLCGANRGAD